MERAARKKARQDPKKRVGQQTRRDPQVDTPESALLGEEEETTEWYALEGAGGNSVLSPIVIFLLEEREGSRERCDERA